jgi:hypothetical protein
MIPDGQPTAALAARCRQLVSAKYRIDDWLDARLRLFLECSWGSGPDSDIDDWLQDVAQNQAVDDKLWLAARHPNIGKMKASTRRPVRGLGRWEPVPYALSPWDFMERVLPGVRMSTYEEPDGILRDVDSSLVIGGTSRRYNSEAASLEDLDRINAEEYALYAKVGTLPLYIAIEGKNRVRAFQLKGKPISAFTGSLYFPSADELELHEVVGSGIFAISGTTSDDPQILILPSVTVPLLKSYGVRWGRRLGRGVAGRRARKFERVRREARSRLASCWPLGS